MKKVLKGTLATLCVLTVVLAIHIYIVTRLGKPDAKTVALARIDVKQGLSEQDASKIGGWLYQQKGVEHVLCNAQSGIVVFSFYPVRESANQIVSDFKANFNYPLAARYVPGPDEMKGGCPVSSSFTYKAYKLFHNI